MPRRRRRKKEEGIKLCPRCGMPYDWATVERRGGNSYVYFYHYLGNKKVKKCYGGAADSYKYVSMLHEKEGLVLTGLLNPSRAVEYMWELSKYLRDNPEKAKEHRRIIEKVIRNLEIALKLAER